MNAEKLKKLQAQVRIGGKGTPRRKKKILHQTAATDDKKLQSSLKKLSVNTIPGIEEVNMIKDDGTVIHFNNPKAQASLAGNTFAITGHAENKQIAEMLPGILTQLGPEGLNQLKRLANNVIAGNKLLSSVNEEDDVPNLVENFEQVAKKDEKSLVENNTQKTVESTAGSRLDQAKLTNVDASLPSANLNQTVLTAPPINEETKPEITKIEAVTAEIPKATELNTATPIFPQTVKSPTTADIPKLPDSNITSLSAAIPVAGVPISPPTPAEQPVEAIVSSAQVNQPKTEVKVVPPTVLTTEPVKIIEQVVTPVETVAKPAELSEKQIEQVAKPAEQPAKQIEQVAKPAEQPAKQIEQVAKPAEQPAKQIEQVAKPAEQPAKPVEDAAKKADLPKAESKVTPAPQVAKSAENKSLPNKPAPAQSGKQAAAQPGKNATAQPGKQTGKQATAQPPKSVAATQPPKPTENKSPPSTQTIKPDAKPVQLPKAEVSKPEGPKPAETAPKTGVVTPQVTPNKSGTAVKVSNEEPKKSPDGAAKPADPNKGKKKDDKNKKNKPQK